MARNVQGARRKQRTADLGVSHKEHREHKKGTAKAGGVRFEFLTTNNANSSNKEELGRYKIRLPMGHNH
jgi:PP-loop superfamily ATP-utilizing enzyme